jgi:formylglycine-generating enzyme required for sulfatase activity
LTMPQFPSVAFVVVFALFGCSGSSELATDIGELSSNYLILDLTTGARSTASSIPDLTTNAAYRDGQMVFRRVEVGSGAAWLAVFEVTQGQWARIGGGTPWTAISKSLVGASAIAPGLPAFNISYEDVAVGLGAWNAGRGVRLEVPTEREWNAAAGTAIWPWGATSDRTSVEANAAVYETQDGVIGPRPVGSKAANPLGFYDLAGNIWEWTSPGAAVRGGSWHDPVIAAATANRISAQDGGIDGLSSHALIGVRLAARLP